MSDETNPEVGGIAVDRLRSLIERIERLEEEKAAIASDIRDIFAEAKSAGFDVKIMKTVIKLRKMNAADRDEQELLLETYRKAFSQNTINFINIFLCYNNIDTSSVFVIFMASFTYPARRLFSNFFNSATKSRYSFNVKNRQFGNLQPCKQNQGDNCRAYPA